MDGKDVSLLAAVAAAEGGRVTPESIVFIIKNRRYVSAAVVVL